MIKISPAVPHVNVRLSLNAICTPAPVRLTPLRAVAEQPQSGMVCPPFGKATRRTCRSRWADIPRYHEI
jgi:hypothetical protein